MGSNNTGFGNTAVGSQALTSNTSGYSNTGKETVSINTAMMVAGTYQYALYVNDILVETKQMIIAR